ncbi:lysine--tRNA ligase [Patescibacteria group bacterium]|nr:lysine--tRNA ligase [Patescibacteria group bacterium]MCG2694842.1 lysine--tRNA ligase [Candidatus Parcubacteria bacterium]
MSSLEDIRQVRLEKLNKLKEAGIDPYPAGADFDFSIKEAIGNFEEDKEVKLVGRVMSLRPQGGLSFFNFTDGTETFQGIIKKEDFDEKDFSFFEDTVDIGDFIQVKGKMFTTKRGQQSVIISDWKMLSKSLRPLPEKWHGLQDIEERYRKRYLDLLMNPEERELFVKKAKFWNTARNFFNKKEFLEVETPSLEITTGGAEARPFVTHHNDFDMDLYLRISVGELWQKRLMSAGFPKTFEIGRIFRNEGTSPDHLQEFTNLEFYWAYADYNDGMELVKELYRELAKEVFGTTEFKAKGYEFDLADDWRKIDYRQEVLDKTGIDILEASEEEMKNKLDELKVKYEGNNRERLTDTLWKYCRKQIAGPAFLINHPKLVAPLSKSTKDNQDLVERFQVILAGSEIGNGYSELNDPVDQKERFENQQKLLERGDEEAMMPDWEFVEMLEYGMPPTCGFGFGERLFSTLVDKPIRETQLFPLMRSTTSNK